MLCFGFGFLRLVYPILSVSLDYPVFIAPSVFSNVYLLRKYRIIFLINTTNQQWEVGIQLTGLTQPYVCSCSNPGHGFSSAYVVLFLCSMN